MDVIFADDDLDKLEMEDRAGGRFSEALVNAFQKRMHLIRNAPDERDFYAMRSLHFERLEGARRHQHSMRLNDQYRLIVELQKQSARIVVKVVAIEDYH